MYNVFYVGVVNGEIRSTIGLAEWMMSKRFKQFMRCISECELMNGAKDVTPSDLQGYYDVLYVPQVSPVPHLFLSALLSLS